MKFSKQAKEFLLRKGDKQVRKMLNKGGRKGVLEDFNKLLVRAIRPSKSSH